MPPNRFDTVLRVALSAGHRDQRSDAELLTQFVDERDQSAFETLIVRHTPGVRAACRGWLRSPADIDDAAQATFLVLVQRARTIRQRSALGGWLYGVAGNVARRLRHRERLSLPLPDDVPGSSPTEPDDLRELLAEEVARLPDKYRIPVQLCYLAGLTAAEAADRLGWPRGTVLTRLAWARERLKKTLSDRGVTTAVPAALLGGAVARPWVDVTIQAGLSVLTGASPVLAGVSSRCVSLTQGMVREMMWNKAKLVACGALLALGGIGFGLHHWVNASSGPVAQASPKANAIRPVAPDGEADNAAEQPMKEARNGQDAKKPDGKAGRRREAVIRLPLGTFVKDVEVAPYGSGRITWNYEEDRVVGLIEASVMGVEVELATEAEYSLSSNGTIYGLLTSVKLNHLRLPAAGELAEIQPFIGLWSLVEPVFAEMMLDLPFSYRFRVQGDRLVITHFRMLLAGPNPLGKLGGVLAGQNDSGGAFAVLAGFQALGTALEGTYAADDGKEKPAARPKTFLKPGAKGQVKFPSFKR